MTARATREPKAGRPHMPGYGISTARKGLLPWSWAVERLAASRNYFVATARPDGAPHVAPVWGVWLDNQLLFSTSGTSRKARNITADPRCVITTERADEVVIVEGVAETAKDGPLLKRFVAAYKEKYDWDMETGTESGPIYAVRPSKVFGFIEHSDQFPTTATRWTF